MFNHTILSRILICSSMNFLRHLFFFGLILNLTSISTHMNDHSKLMTGFLLCAYGYCLWTSPTWKLYFFLKPSCIFPMFLKIKHKLSWSLRPFGICNLYTFSCYIQDFFFLTLLTQVLFKKKPKHQRLFPSLLVTLQNLTVRFYWWRQQLL